MASFYTARSNTISPLPWTNLTPPRTHHVKFNNRITGIAAGGAIDGIDFLNENDTVFFTVSGSKSKGIEDSIPADVMGKGNIFSSLTVNDPVYTDTVVDPWVG